MYLEFFGLKREPFHISPDPYFFYFGPTHKEAYAALIYAIRNRKGFVAITGEVGLGKTTVVRTFLNHFKDQHKLKIILIFNTKLSFKNLLKLILLELGFNKQNLLEIERNSPDDESFEVESVELLYNYLIEQYRRGINVVLILDEAQNLPVITLEKLRLISNLETEKNKLIQIFLIGQPELDKKLSLKSLRQLKQRIELRVKLKELNKKEVGKYIDFRLKKAGYVGKNIFTKSAIRKIYKYSNGIPRKINIICDNALITAFGQDKKKIGPRIIKEVGKELYSDERKSKFSKLSYTLIFCIIFLVSFYFGTRLNEIKPYLPLVKNTYKKPNKSKFPIQDKVFPLSNTKQKVIIGNTLLNNTNQGLKVPPQEKSDIMPSTKNNKGSAPNNKTVTNRKSLISNKTEKVQQDLATKKEKLSLINNNGNEPKKTNFLKNTLIEKLDTSGKIVYLILQEKLPFFKRLSNVRQIVLVEMAKQTSIKGLFSFKNMLSALENGDYNLAARHMLYSNWYKRVGENAIMLSEIMKNNN
ncbi:AAA family ATPase, partial [Desulfothermus okinawensis]